MVATDTPKGPARALKDPSKPLATLLDVLRLNKDEALAESKQLGLKLAGLKLFEMQNAIILKLKLSNNSDAAEANPGPSSTRSFESQMQLMFQQFANTISISLSETMTGFGAQLGALTGQLAETARINQDLTAKLAASDARLGAMEGELRRLKDSSTGMQPAAMQAAFAQAAADAAEIEEKKLKLRLTRLPDNVKSQTDAEALVPMLMEALDVDVVATKVTYIRPSFKAALTTSAGTSSAKTGAVLVTVGSVQAKSTILMARKRLKDSQRFAKMGVEEDLTKMQQEAKNLAWPAFVAAKKRGDMASWRAEKLYIGGHLYSGIPTTDLDNRLASPTLFPCLPSTSSAHSTTSTAPVTTRTAHPSPQLR